MRVRDKDAVRPARRRPDERRLRRKGVIARFASVVGRENVIAGAYCGFASIAATCEVHPSVVWVKLAALAEGARIASWVLSR